MKKTHVYERKIKLEDYSKDSLALIFSKIPNGSKVLDVGAGSGGLGESLKRLKDCVVHGLTYNEDELALLNKKYDLALAVDLEREALPAVIASGAYDVVVCGDVLEHLRNAHDVLHALGKCLKSSGCIFISVPNVTHISIITSLIGGQFPRTYEGLLDATHVHFFERVTLAALCKHAGMHVLETDAVRRHMNETEFSHLDYTAIPVTVWNFLKLLPDADIYQHVWKLKPLAEHHFSSSVVSETLQRPQVELTPRFELRAYWDVGGGFNEAQTVTGWGFFSDEMVSIELPLSAMQQPICAVRVDWPAYCGIFELEAIELIGLNDELIASWTGEWGKNVQLSSCKLLSDIGRHGLPLMYLYEANACVRLSLNDPEIINLIRVKMSSPRRMRTKDEYLLDYSELILPEIDKLKSQVSMVLELLKPLTAINSNSIWKIIYSKLKSYFLLMK